MVYYPSLLALGNLDRQESILMEKQSHLVDFDTNVLFMVVLV